MHSNDIFPISASPFEEYLLQDDRSGYPMTMPLLCLFQGNVDLCTLAEAFDKTILHEPLFCAIAQRRNNRHCWVIASEPPRLVTETNSTIGDMAASEGIEPLVTLDVTKTPGVHCSYIPMSGGFAIRLHLHHAICDGLASILFLGNWMAEYARLIGNNSDLTVNHPISERIKSRTDLHIELPHPLSRWTIARSFMKELRLWFCRPVYRLSPQNVANTDATSVKFDNPILLWKLISHEDVVRIRQKARSLNVSLNSYITGQYLLYLCNWIGKENISGKQWLRLLVPTSLRKPIHWDNPASNMLGYAFLDRRASACLDSDTFYQSIDHDIDLIKKWSMGAMFISGLNIVQRIPFVLSTILSSKHCLATSVFSNIGNPCKALPYPHFKDSGTIEVGGAKLYRLIGGPPIRPNTPICGGLIQQNDEAVLSIVVDSQRFGLENCREFLRKFIDHILRAV